jgi:homoserine acetyltransferase
MVGGADGTGQIIMKMEKFFIIRLNGINSCLGLIGPASRMDGNG